jgi:hypothetical protein
VVWMKCWFDSDIGLMKLEWRIETKTSKKGDEYLYLVLEGIGRYPITNVGKDGDGNEMIMFPCLYLPKSMKDKWGEDAEAYRQIVERMSDYGRVEFAEDGEWDKLWGDRRLLPKSADERIDGEMAFVYNKEESKAWLARAYKND